MFLEREKVAFAAAPKSREKERPVTYFFLRRCGKIKRLRLNTAAVFPI